MSSELAQLPPHLWAEGGKCYYRRAWNRYSLGTSQRYRYYELDLDKNMLWRVYARTKKRMHSVGGGYTNPMRYVQIYDLQPITPKWLTVDQGL